MFPFQAVPTLLSLGLGLASHAGAALEAIPAPAPEVAEPAATEQFTPAVEQAIRLLRILRDPAAPPIASLAVQVQTTEPEVLDALLAILDDREVPGSGSEEPQVLSVFQEDLISKVFERSARFQVLEAIQRHSNARPEGASAAVLTAFGAVGGSGDVRELLALALDEDAEALDPRVGEALESALVSIASRHPDIFSSLEVQVHTVRPELLAVIVTAVGQTHDPRGVELLADIVDRREDLVALVSSQVRMLGPSRSLAVNTRLSASLRPHLEGGGANLQRATMMALAELEDYYSLPTLIELLGSEDAGLSENALWSLRRLTDLSYGADRERWAAWYEDELAWAQTGLRAERMRLNSSNPANAAAAIREYSRHRLFRHDLAMDVEVVLQRPETALRIAACETLAQLGSVYSMPALVDLMSDPRMALREAAGNALGRISGRELPAEPDAWLAVIETGL